MDEARILEGDALQVLPTLEAGSVDAVVTDPPYGIGYQSAWRTDKAKRHKAIANDGQPFVWFLPGAYAALKPEGCLVCFCRWDTAEAFRLALGWAGFRVGAQLVWDRMDHGMGDPSSRPSPQHDLAWFAVKGRYRLPGKRPASVYRHARLPGADLLHPNQKPVSLLCEMVTDYTRPGDLVLDPFCGAGSTGVACVRKGRRFLGIELSPTYAEVARQQLANQQSDGPLFARDFPSLFAGEGA